MSDYQEHEKCRGCGEKLWGLVGPGVADIVSWELRHNEANCLWSRLDHWARAAKADGYPCDDPNCLQAICRVARGGETALIHLDNGDILEFETTTTAR